MRPAASRALALILCLQLALLDVALRGPAFYAAHPRAVGYLIASAASLWLVADLALGRAARIAAALTMGAAVTPQLAFYRYFHAPFDDQAAVAARLAWVDVRPVVVHAAPALVASTLVIAGFELLWLSFVAPIAPRRGERRPRVVAGLLLGAGLVLGGPLGDATTEIRTARAAVSFISTSSPRRSAGERLHLPPLESRRGRVPNVLLVVSESIRASAFCGDAAEPCPLSPEIARLLPSRVPLLEMRAVASYTAVSMSVLFTGLPQVGPRKPIQAAPDLFDFVHAVRADGRGATIHYWSAHKSSFFEREDPRAAVDSFIDAEEMIGHPIEDVEEAVAGGLDRRLADECARRIARLEPPYVALVHFSGTHAPYFFDEASAPFVPFGRVVTWSGLKDLERSYLNAIVEQDRSVARCMKAFLDAQTGPHLIVYTSDHGEAFGEHSAIHHGQNLYDEQIHVPAFVYAGGGALSPDESAALASAIHANVTHYDVLPTILDALGILDHVGLSIVHAPPLPGRSLLRPPPDRVAPLPITNCTEMWSCPLNVWGLLDGKHKLTAQGWDGAWRCMSLADGEREVPLSECADLVRASRGVFAKRPNGDPNE